MTQRFYISTGRAVDAEILTAVPTVGDTFHSWTVTAVYPVDPCGTMYNDQDAVRNYRYFEVVTKDPTEDDPDFADETDTAYVAVSLEDLDIVFTDDGEGVNFSAAVELMDDEIREQLHREGYTSKQAFFDAYQDAHREKFGEDFQVC